MEILPKLQMKPAADSFVEKNRNGKSGRHRLRMQDHSVDCKAGECTFNKKEK